MWSTGEEKFGKGGGFVAGGGGFNSPKKDGDKSKGPKRSQNCVPVTIRQLVECPEDTLKIEGMEVYVVSIVGVVKSVETTTTKVSFRIEDTTGSIEAFNYVGTDSDGAAEAVTILSEGTYGRVVGQLRTQKGVKTVLIFKVFPISDMNELTCHLFEVLQVPVGLKKLREQEASRTGVGMNNSLSTSMMGSSFGEASVSTSNGGGAVAVSNGGNQLVNGLNLNQSMVFNVLKGCRDDTGLHKEQIVQNLKGKLPPKDVLTAIDFLSGEGHIFSTVDDDHYKCTDW